MAAATSRRRRRVRLWLANFAVAAVAIVLLSVPIFAPRVDAYDAREVDAVFILGPPTAARIAAGERIAQDAGGVPVYLSVWSGVVCKPKFVCVHAEPWTTAGEAAALAAAVRDDGLRHPLVVTSTVHVMRARYIIDRCVPGKPPVIGVRHSRPWWDVLRQPVYQWGAMVKAVVAGCADAR